MLIYIYCLIGSKILKCNLISKNAVWRGFHQSCNAVVQPLVLIDETPLSQVDKQKYLGVVFDSKLTWSSHVAAACKTMAYYLYLINFHSKSFHVRLKMLVESLVFSWLIYALSVGGQQYIRILYSELIIYITGQSILFVDCISQNMFLDIAKLLDGFPCLC